MSKRGKTYTLEELKAIEIPLGNAEDLQGIISGKLTALFRVKGKNTSSAVWACQCECGKYCIAKGSDLKRHNKTSCGKCAYSDEYEYLWDIDMMLDYCYKIAPGYKILKVENRLFPTGEMRKYVLMQCPNKNHDPYWVMWQHFLNGKRCAKCHYEKNNMVKWDGDKAYDFLSKYGFIMVNKNDFKDTHSCFDCYNNEMFMYRISIHDFQDKLKRNNGIPSYRITQKNNPHNMYNIKRFIKLYRPDYKILETEYLGTHSDHLFEYIGNNLPDGADPTFKCQLNMFLYEYRGHPGLKRSKGETRIEKALCDLNVLYSPQHSFDDCRDIMPLPFDFYIANSNIVIEYQGMQHYEPVEYFGGEEAFQLRIKHDKMKADYCARNGIKLIVIPYWDFENIEEILKAELNISDNNELIA